jgi:hypothetical protein
VEDDRERPVSAAPAADPALPSLKKDNCISNGKYRSVFVAQENIRLFIWKAGEQNVGALTVTAADCLEVRDFQEKWHSFLNALKKELPCGMWTRERQPRSGNWHAHAAVNVGWDIKSDFPRNQVAKSFYANVDPRLRKLWKYLREKAASRGLGRVELLPLKYSGAACAKYFTKYLTKAVASEKNAGDEKCRLFGVWGGVRFVRSRFSFLSSRIVQKRKEWLAQELGLSDAAQLSQSLGPHWWFHVGRALCEVIMPDEFYQVGRAGVLRWDQIGLRARARNWEAWPGAPSDDLTKQSQFTLFWEIGERLYANRTDALRFAVQCMAKPEPAAPMCPDRQRESWQQLALRATGPPGQKELLMKYGWVGVP